MRRLEVNGTAKVYFVEEKAGCHATMGRMVGMPWWQRAPRDQEGYELQQKGPSRSGRNVDSEQKR